MRCPCTPTTSRALRSPPARRHAALTRQKANGAPAGGWLSRAAFSRNAIFRDQALANVPIMRSVGETLRMKKDGSMKSDFFINILDEHFPHAEAVRQFEVVVDWGRYAELFEYDARQELLHLSS